MDDGAVGFEAGSVVDEHKEVDEEVDVDVGRLIGEKAVTPHSPVVIARQNKEKAPVENFMMVVDVLFVIY